MKDPLLYNLPPHNLEQEESLLAYMFLHTTHREEIFELVKPSEFYKTAHQIIFQAMFDLDDIDLVTVTTRLKETGKLSNVGGAVYLASLLDCPLSLSPIGSAVKIHECFIRRELIRKSNDIINRAFDCDNAQKLIDEAQAEINAISLGGTQDNFHHISELLPESLDRYEKAIANKDKVIKTGWEKFDKFIRLDSTKYVVIAGRPSMGKTSLIKNIAIRIAKRDFPAVIFSLEMSKESIIDSTVSESTGISNIKLYNSLDRVDYDKIHSAMDDLHELPIYIDDDYKAKDIYELKRRCRIAVKKLGARIIFIDQASKLGGITGLKKTEESSKYSNIISDIAKELKIPVVLLVQINREAEKNKDSKPTLANLKQSGAYEEDADITLLLYRKGYYSKEPNDTTAEIIIAKQRIGPTGHIQMEWDAKRMEFNEVNKPKY